MRTLLIASLASLLLATACGDDGGNPTIDAPGGAAVTMIACAGATVTAEVGTVGFAFDPPSTTIAVGQIVRFTMPADHNAASDTPGQFRTGLGATSCFRFDVAGSYPFHCEPHLFTGVIVVQ